METLTKTSQKVNFIEGYFSPAEASDILLSLLDVKINFHKVKRLSILEGNQDEDCLYDTDRINELYEERQKTMDFLKEMKKNGGMLKIESTIHIETK